MKAVASLILMSALGAAACASKPVPPEPNTSSSAAMDNQYRTSASSTSAGPSERTPLTTTAPPMEPSTMGSGSTTGTTTSGSTGSMGGTGTSSGTSSDQGTSGHTTGSGAAAISPAPTPPPRSDTDNTGVNERDRSAATLTPFDQGGSASDRTITQKVRQAVVGDKSLSFTAKNVKIITVDGKVTLRGPVNSDQERTTIEAKAKSVPGVKQVDNLIEVKR